MGITDELREAFNGCTVMAGVENDFECVYITKQAALNLLDEIDAAHERELGEAQGTTVYMPDQCVKLPVDADGEPIHTGDVMELINDKNVIRTVSGVGAGVFFTWSKDIDRYTQCIANAYRHHPEPTIEDVLREFAFQIGQSATDDGIVAEYAEKLRLADREEA